MPVKQSPIYDELKTLAFRTLSSENYRCTLTVFTPCWLDIKIVPRRWYRLFHDRHVLTSSWEEDKKWSDIS
ncbi:hypothetical protein JTB14_000800 [Gonioctena quinquepunctata]|nr:hypothetical protein JTB14_000800 [Gonioctena quinquepunctata]